MLKGEVTRPKGVFSEEKAGKALALSSAMR